MPNVCWATRRNSSPDRRPNAIAAPQHDPESLLAYYAMSASIARPNAISGPRRCETSPHPPEAMPGKIANRTPSQRHPSCPTPSQTSPRRPHAMPGRISNRTPSRRCHFSSPTPSRTFPRQRYAIPTSITHPNTIPAPQHDSNLDRPSQRHPSCPTPSQMSPCQSLRDSNLDRPSQHHPSSPTRFQPQLSIPTP
jgi:hypothetical protein